MSYKENIKIILGKKGKKIMLFTLTTCIWCDKVKELLEELNLEYSYLDLDVLEEKDGEEAFKEVGKYNPNLSFPTMVIDNGKKVIIGFNEDEIRSLSNGK